MRERLTSNEPSLISQCLLYIRLMDQILKPYEELRRWTGAERARHRDSDSQQDREMRLLDDISRRIVVETMIRGWPSFYLDDEEDRAVFDSWANQYRGHIWSLIAKQANDAGVALELLLEDNIVYDVRFNDDLGCTVQPLMLADDAAHAQVHGGGAGASAVVPLWTRRSVNEMPREVIQLAPNNRERAARLIHQACLIAAGPAAAPLVITEKVKLALACHPAEAGKRILQEWGHRLGRDTKEEFERGKNIITATELVIRQNRYTEARILVDAYLDTEPVPLPDAYVIAALAEMIRDEGKLTRDEGKLIEDREKYFRYQRLEAIYNEQRERVREILARFPSDPVSGSYFINLTQLKGDEKEQLERFKWLETQLGDLQHQLEALRKEVEAGTKERKRLIEKALEQPASVRKTHPALALAAKQAKAGLEAVLETDCLYKLRSESYVLRYADLAKSVEVRGLLDIRYKLAVLYHRIGKAPNETRRDALLEMERLAKDIWLPDLVKSDLKMIAEEFGKGDWDRLQANTIRNLILPAASTCHARMQDLMSDLKIIGLSLKEPIVTRIHVLHIMDAKYNQALELLLTATVPFGLTTASPWQILNRAIRVLPEGARLSFVAHTGMISLETQTDRTPLLQAQPMTAEEIAHISSIVADTDFLVRINRHAPSLAEGILAVEVEPNPEWGRWRDAIAPLRRELIFTLSIYGYEACLMPEHAPPVSETGDDFESRMDNLTPRRDPIVDWQWKDLGTWSALAEPQARRVTQNQSVP